ncbi:MAG TPA: CFI-box-CTERM domain-containing protein [Polyangiales bacterium]|nr:CFI-box-CTERM domain-containing protein [Polyangiales bacterium]
MPDSAKLGLLQLEFTPVASAQVAIWVERATGEFVATVRLTEAVARRGIGNRPGASQMNSGFRWPYGRREGVLPVWGTRRASAPGAKMFRRVIFQNRSSEGLASRTSNDFSQDDYYCLSFNRDRSTKEALDAVSCASVFSSDKGRFVTDADVARNYAEPYEPVGSRDGTMRALSLDSLYPPRRDVTRCEGMCNDHVDVEQYNAHSREVMPDIDAVTMATPVGGVRQRILFEVPTYWEPGEYRACVEVNVEGDYNSVFNNQTFPTPLTPMREWDSWATGYGYPYRGQPSVVYCAPIEIGSSEDARFTVDTAIGSAGTWSYEDPKFGELRPMEGMTDDPVGAPGSGADRLELQDDGSRLAVTVTPSLACDEDDPPGGVDQLALGRHPDKLNAHQWVRLQFRAADDDHGIFRYDVRVSTEPITDDASFMTAMPAKQATIEAAELLVPSDGAAGELIRVDMGGLVQETHYFIAVRAMDGCAGKGPIRSAELTTPKREFATVTPCFVATAAWGTPLASEIGVLRGLRDRHMLSNAVGRAAVSAYYALGPTLAGVIAEREGLRAAARALLTPIVELARWLDE